MKCSKLFTSAISALFIVSILGVTGCGENGLTALSHFRDIQQGFHKSDTIPKKDFQSSEYLQLKTYKISEMTGEDFKILGQAIGRLDVYTENGLYHIRQTTGAQVNISEQLFQYIKKGYEHSNEMRKHPCGCIRIED
jgi:hypothetical protein